MKSLFVIGALCLGLMVMPLRQEALAQVEQQSFPSEEAAEAAGWKANDEGQNPARDCDGCETDLGWKPTDLAGGADAGEGGGLVHRSGTLPIGFYGDTSIGELTLEMPILASGKITLINQNFDGHLHFGFFDAARLFEDPLDYGADLGFLLAEPGGGVAPNFRWGPQITTDGGNREGTNHNAFETGLPGEESLDFSIKYDPDGGTAGLLTLVMGDEPEAELELTEAQREDGATLTAFGISTGPYTGSGRPDFMQILIDDVSYTSLLADITPGDFNDDGKVDLVDFGILADNFDTGTTFEQGDNNFDGQVDLKDFAEFREIYNSQPGAAAAVPEPSGLIAVSLGIACVAAAARRRRRASS